MTSQTCPWELSPLRPRIRSMVAKGEILGRDLSLLPPPESPVDFPIEPVDLDEIPETFHRQLVPYHGFEEPGTIIVDPSRRFLYLVLEDSMALRYGVGVGRAGFGWSGEAPSA